MACIEIQEWVFTNVAIDKEYYIRWRNVVLYIGGT